MEEFLIKKINGEEYLLYQIGIDLNDFRETFWFTENEEDIESNFVDKIKPKTIYIQTSVNHININGEEISLWLSLKNNMGYGLVKIDTDKEYFKKDLLEYIQCKLIDYKYRFHNRLDEDLIKSMIEGEQRFYSFVLNNIFND